MCAWVSTRFHDLFTVSSELVPSQTFRKLDRLRQPGTVTARSEYTPQMTPYVYEVCVPEYPVLSIVNARAQDADAGSARNKARNPRLKPWVESVHTVSVCDFEFAMYGFITSNQHA
jgi:hypothetical protein